MLARGMGGEGESAFRAILPGQDNFILWVFNLHEHAKPRGGRLVLLSLLVIQLRPVVSWREAGRAQSEEREVAPGPRWPGHCEAACSRL